MGNDLVEQLPNTGTIVKERVEQTPAHQLKYTMQQIFQVIGIQIIQNLRQIIEHTDEKILVRIVSC